MFLWIRGYHGGTSHPIYGRIPQKGYLSTRPKQTHLQLHLSVKDPLVCTDDVLVTEEQVEVLEGLCQEEGLLHIILLPPNLEKGDFDPNPDFTGKW